MWQNIFNGVLPFVMALSAIIMWCRDLGIICSLQKEAIWRGFNTHKAHGVLPEVLPAGRRFCQ